MEPAPVSVEYAIGPLRPGDGEAIAAWRYEPPWDVYDLAPDEAPTADEGYLGVYDGDVLLGFFCTGEEARVPGLAAVDGVVDLGVGMAPDRTGAGRGAGFARAVIAHLRADGATRVRVVVQAWNARSLRLSTGLGLERTGVVVVEQGGAEVEYAVLEGDLRDLP
ncbi:MULTISPECIES: GNAT family N-acetyltransferase [Tsukamurella]|uniref:GNAT family N-acetyltransferase n=2 Tax=Tsukamurella TaxID=2060 RepID=A0A5C5S6A2_9ACTN|nr:MULTISPECIES: GNAT family N-acetyltransferase [Tsukamurella]NMD55446.1 GNAT family N-acetyltransferase [Tsukamurella columbiensis]TWS30604.1 GNAT family N-acetyltransferase [Tsukamurella conjunctivitidis]